ncbi:MAG: hypothetical protein ACE5GO_06305 [Anaerolineales bacterium]
MASKLRQVLRRIGNRPLTAVFIVLSLALTQGVSSLTQIAGTSSGSGNNYHLRLSVDGTQTSSTASNDVLAAGKDIKSNYFVYTSIDVTDEESNAYPISYAVASPTADTTWYLYFPLVQRNDGIINGDFETGDLAGWETGKGPFSGHGSGLPQAVVSFDSSWRGQLGNPSAQDGAIPVGYGYLSQTFRVDKPYLLQIRYRVFTRDTIKGIETGRYFDSFEVSLNTPPDQISDDDRNGKGCGTTLLNPTGVLTPSEGLVFCGGYKASDDDVGVLRDIGWKMVSLDLQNLQGNTTLYFTLWSREYEPQFYNDQAHHNTWVYIDDVQLEIPTPCPSADAEGTVPPAVAIDSVTFVVNDIEQVVRDDDALHASPGDRVLVSEVTICVEPFSGNGGAAYIELTPIDQSGQDIVSEIKSTQDVGVTSDFTTIPGPGGAWIIGDNWRHISVVSVHYPPSGTQDPTCENWLCERDDREIVRIE